MRVVRHLEDHGSGGQVGGRGQIDTAHAVARPQLGQIVAGRVVEFLKGQPSLGRGFPDVKFFADQILDFLGVCLSTRDLVGQLLPILDRTQTGVGFCPAVWVGPLAPCVQLVDKGDKVRIVCALWVTVTVDDARGVLVPVVVDVLAHGACRGSDEYQRLLARGRAVGHDVIERTPVLPLVNLVHQNAVDVQTI